MLNAQQILAKLVSFPVLGGFSNLSILQWITDYLDQYDSPSEGFNYNVAKMKVAPHFNPNKSGYELLISKGVEIVVNDSLRMAISDLYESYYPYYDQYEKNNL